MLSRIWTAVLLCLALASPARELRADVAAAKAAYLRGAAFETAKNYLAALKEYQASLKAEPRYFYAYKQMGNCYYYLGYKAYAVQCYDKYLASAPADAAVKAMATRLRAAPAPPVLAARGNAAPVSSSITVATAGAKPQYIYQTWQQPAQASTSSYSGKSINTFNLGNPDHSSFAIVVKGGLSIPSGDLQSHTDSLMAAAFEALYSPITSFSVDGFYQYVSLKYKDAAAASPFVSNAVGLKGLYRFLQTDSFAPFIDLGAGMFFINHAYSKYALTDAAVLNSAGSTDVDYKSDNALGFLGGIGFEVTLYDHLRLTADANIQSVSLGGGTSDSIMFSTISAGFMYVF